MSYSLSFSGPTSAAKIDCFYVFLSRRLERRFDLFHCTGSSKRNSTADESCVFVVGKTTFFVLESKADSLPRSRNRQRKI